MEDDDDSQLSSSSIPASPALSPPRATDLEGRPFSGGITVAASPPSGTHQLPVTLALPIQQPRQTNSSSSAAAAAAAITTVPTSGREDCWSEGATSALIDAWGERFLVLSRGTLRHKHWQEVADAVNSRDDYTKTPKSDAQCKNRIDVIKKRYKNEKSKVTSSPSFTPSWPFFHRLDLLLGHTYKASSSNNVPPKRPPAPPQQIAQKSRIPSSGKMKKPSLASDMEEEQITPYGGEGAGESSESLPPETGMSKKRRRAQGLRELAMAVAWFGEVYERVEKSRMEIADEMEKRRIAFSKEMEKRRMQFFSKAQMEITLSNSTKSGGGHSKRNSGGGGSSSKNRHSRQHHYHHLHQRKNSNDSEEELSNSLED